MRGRQGSARAATRNLQAETGTRRLLAANSGAATANRTPQIAQKTHRFPAGTAPAGRTVQVRLPASRLARDRLLLKWARVPRGAQ